jgi:hypothetical protein
MRLPLALWATVSLSVAPAVQPAAVALGRDQAALVVLAPTGRERDGLPVMKPHPEAARIAATLQRGFSGRMLRLYAWVQHYLQREDGRVPEPAYLVLSDHAGGFARVGLYLDTVRKADAGWVDLRVRGRLTGRFGSPDQIFPHELMHVIVRELAGPAPTGHSTQVHAIGLQTDPEMAFSEGMAEAMQVLSIDDADAAPETRALQTDTAVHARAERRLSLYVHELTWRWWPVHPLRMLVPLWYSEAEQTLRYFGVRSNVFANAVPIQASLLERDNGYPAYLANSIGLGDSTTQPKSPAVMLSTEGVVAHLVWRLVTDSALQRNPAPPEFYARAAITRDDVSPLEHAFIKLFIVLHESKATTMTSLLDAYERQIPTDAPRVNELVHQALLGQPLPRTPAIWLQSSLFTGTSIYDQYRARPRRHTFDANAATVVDWMTIPGMRIEDANSLVAGTPYATLAQVIARAPAAAKPHVRLEQSQPPGAAGVEETLQLSDLLPSYLWRLLGVLAACALFGSLLARRGGIRRRWAAALVALSASGFVFLFAWVIISPAWLPACAPLLVGALPWAAWRIMRRQSAPSAILPFFLWALAALPAVLVVWISDVI